MSDPSHLCLYVRDVRCWYVSVSVRTFHILLPGPFVTKLQNFIFQSICAQLTTNFSLRSIGDKRFTMEGEGEKVGMHMMTVCILQC